LRPLETYSGPLYPPTVAYSRVSEDVVERVSNPANSSSIYLGTLGPMRNAGGRRHFATKLALVGGYFAQLVPSQYAGDSYLSAFT